MNAITDNGLNGCCRSAVADQLRTCPACGSDIGALTDEVERLTSPSATWHGGVVIPMAPLRELPPATRRTVAAAIRRAMDQ